MLRISQRAVDYATKSYQSGRPEYSQEARSGRGRLNHLSHRISIVSSELSETQQLEDAQLAFIEAVHTISAALFFTCHHAYDVSSHAAELSARGVYIPSNDLVTTCAHINSAMRLCAVALMKKEVEHAKQVLREIELYHRSTSQGAWPRGITAQSMLTQTIHEQSIARCLLKIMDSIRIIASESATLLVSKLGDRVV